MHDYNNYELDTDRRRIMVGAQLGAIIRDWIKECGRIDGKDEEIINNSGGKIFEFGSYRLGVHSPGTDIDALVVAPRHIDRDRHFFGILPGILEKTEGVSDLILVREAFVPCIKFEYKRVDIDLLFARVELKEVSDSLESLQENDILRNCDSESIKSLNGRRATDAIINEIPNM
jgi:poly(A) polymerase